MKSLLVLVLALVGVVEAHAEEICGKDKVSEVEYSWCITSDPASKNPDVIYYMHGGGGDEHQWSRATGTGIQENYKRKNLDVPTAIVFSFGRTWLLGDVPNAEGPGLLPLVLDHIMPTLEAKIGGVKGKRMIAGHSMGGFNGAEMALRAPHLFARAALLCPGLVDLNAFATDEEIAAYMKTQNPEVKVETLVGLMKWVQAVVGTLEGFLRHDPMTLVQSAKPTGLLYYVSCTKDDAYPFFTGSQKFATTLKENGVPVTWVPIEKGGHCAQTPESAEALATFLQEGVK